MLNRTLTQTTRPADLPVQLDRRLTWIDAVIHLAGGAACGLVAWLLLLAVSWATSGVYEWKPSTWVSVILGGGFGVVFGIAGTSLVVAVILDLSLGIKFRLDWHNQALWERQETGGNEEVVIYSETSFRCDNPQQFLLACLAAYWYTRRNDNRLSIDKLRSIGFDDNSGSLLLGDMPESQARQLLDILDKSGLLQGRKERVGGRLVVGDADQFLAKIIPLARRLQGKRGGEE